MPIGDIDDPTDYTKFKSLFERFICWIINDHWYVCGEFEIYNPYYNIKEYYKRQVNELNWNLYELCTLRNTFSIFYFAGWHGLIFHH